MRDWSVVAGRRGPAVPGPSGPDCSRRGAHARGRAGGRPRPGQLPAGAHGRLATLGVEPGDLHGVLLTHIHLDHGGAAGTLVRQHPWMKVYVHGRGAPHLVDPAKLLASATRLYGDQMDRLWGEFAPVPAGNIVVPADGGVIDVGGAAFDVAHTAGHASHHVCYRDRRSGVVYAGDTGVSGSARAPTSCRRPPARHRRARVAGEPRHAARMGACGVFVTHFGPIATPRPTSTR